MSLLHMSCVRLASDDDADALAALVNSAYRSPPVGGGWTSESHILGGQRIDAGMVRATLAEPDSHVVLFYQDRDLVGCIHIKKKDLDLAYLGLLAVRPDTQGRGLGAQLMAYAESWISRNWDIMTVEITVIPLRTDLVAWYQRRGYRFTDETRAFPYGDDRFGIPRRDDLVLGVMRKALAKKGL